MKKLAPQPVLSMADRVFDSVYRDLVTLRLPPAMRLSETEVAQRLGVSRQPVRDAFYRLSRLGFLDIQPQRATLVAAISERHIRDAIFIRTALECASLDELPALRAEQLADLSDQLDEQRAALSAQDIDRFEVLDEGFHKTLCDLSGRKTIWPLILEHKGHLDRLRGLTFNTWQADAVREHQSILDALIAGRPDSAKALMQGHLSKLMHILPLAKQNHPHMF